MLTDFIKDEEIHWFRHRIWKGHRRSDGQPVIIKVLKGVSDADDAYNEFAAEAQRLAALNHPCLPKVLWWGKDGGSPCVVVEKVELPPLRDQIGMDRWGIQEALDVIAAVCGTLAWVEAQDPDLPNLGTVITPHHVRISQDRRSVRLLGLYALFHDGIVPQANVGLVNPDGPISSMAPEKLREGGDGDVRSDLFTLGFLLHTMLLGRWTFSDPSQSMVHQCSAVIFEPTPPVLTARPEVGPELERAVLRALEKLPSQRPATARAWLLELLSCCPAALTDPKPHNVAQMLQAARALVFDGDTPGLARLVLQAPRQAAEPVVSDYLWEHLQPGFEAALDGREPWSWSLWQSALRLPACHRWLRLKRQEPGLDVLQKDMIQHMIWAGTGEGQSAINTAERAPEGEDGEGAGVVGFFRRLFGGS